MRLIDADKFIEYVESSPLSENAKGTIFNLIANQPIAYDVDKIVAKLNAEKEVAYSDFEYYAENNNIDEEYDDYFHCGLGRAIDIVKGGSDE